MTAPNHRGAELGGVSQLRARPLTEGDGDGTSVDMGRDRAGAGLHARGSECNVGGVVKWRETLELVDTDDDDKATGFVYRFFRLGDALEAEEVGEAKGDSNEPASCGANGHVSGVFFLSRSKS